MSAAEIALEWLSGANPLPENYPGPGLVNEFCLSGKVIFQCFSDGRRWIKGRVVCAAPSSWGEGEVRLAVYKILLEIWAERKTSGTKKLRAERMKQLVARAKGAA